MDDYTRQILRVAVAQICQTIGWHTIQSTPLELLTDILHKYLQELSRETHRYTELYGRTDANLDDVALAFQDLSINVPDLLEYINNVDSVPCAVEVPKYPIRKESSLNFLKPGSKEVVTRPVHVHEYLPAIYPEKEVEEETAGGSVGGVGGANNGVGVGPQQQSSTGHSLCANASNPSPASSFAENNNNPIPPGDSLPPTICENELFKKPEISEIAVAKKPRILHEDEGRPTREISSVMMTSSGFISPAREGKLPDTKIPIIPETKPIIRPASPQPQPTSVAATSASIQLLPVVGSSSLLPPSIGLSTTGIEPSKIEKKVKRQRQSLAPGAVSNLETKEQRKRERQLARLQKLNAAATASGGLPMTTAAPSSRKGGASNSGKKQKMKHLKTKYAASQASPLLLPPPPLQASELESHHGSGASTVGLPPPPPLTSVNLPADLTIRPETVPIVPALQPQPLSYDGNPLYHAGNSGLIELDHHKPNIIGDIKLSNEPDRQKSHIFKKISKRSRDDDHHHSHHHHHGTKQATIPAVPHHSLYSGLPPLPESTTIRAIPSVAMKSDVIVVDDDPPPPVRLPSTQILPIPPLAALQMPAFAPSQKLPKVQPTKTARKQRKTNQTAQQKDLMRRILLEQSAPLNLSSAMTPQLPDRFNTIKPPRKTKAKAEKINKRSAAAYSDMPDEPKPPAPQPLSGSNLLPENLSRDDLSSLNILPAMPPYPGMMLYQFPPLIPRPGLIPTNNPLLQFRNPFAYNDFMSLSLRAPLRMNEPPPTPSPPPLDLDSSVYCNVAPLVPDSLKFQLAAKAAGLGKLTKTTTGSSFLSSTSSHTVASGNFETVIKSSSVTATITRPTTNDAPIEISDDEKIKSDPEPDRPGSNDGGGMKFSPTKSRNDQSKMTIDDDFDNPGGGGEAATPSEQPRPDQQPTPGTSGGGGASAKSEKKRDKEHKKGKRGKDGKMKKKKDKKDKSKSKERAEKRKEEKKDKSKKQKKEKRKEKMRAMSYNSGSDTKPNPADPQHDHHPSSSSVPKLTLKFGSPRSVAGGPGGEDSSDGRKIKLINVGGDAGVCDEESIDDIGMDERRESSPELARISPLVTRPPKQKSSAKDKNSDTEQSMGNAVASTSSGSTIASAVGGGGVAATVLPIVAPTRGPGRPPKNANAGNNSGAVSGGGGAAAAGTSSTQSHHHQQQQQHHSISSNMVSSTTSSLPLTPGLVAAASSSLSAMSSGRTTIPPAAAVVTSSTSTGAQSVVDSTDAEGNQVWICPACGRVDDGTPMIGCDGCDAWYHWVCVGIQVPPDEREDWYCRVCIAKKQEANGSDKKKKRKKKNKAN